MKDLAQKVYLDGADDAFEYLSHWLETTYFEDGLTYGDFHATMEILYRQYLNENRIICTKMRKN